MEGIRDCIDSNVINHIYRYALRADYINIHQCFEWHTNEYGAALISHNDITQTIIMTIEYTPGAYYTSTCGALPIAFGTLQGALEFVRKALATPADAFYGTLTPISIDHKQQIVLAVVAEIARNIRAGAHYSCAKKLVPIPFALTNSDMIPTGIASSMIHIASSMIHIASSRMKEFSADLLCGDRLILWMTDRDETYDVYIRDVFGLFRVFRIVFDNDDTDVDGEYLSEWVFRVRVFGGSDKLVEIRAVNIEDVKLSEDMERNLLCDVESRREGVYARVIVDQLKRVLSHERAVDLFDYNQEKINGYLRGVLGHDIVRTDVPIKRFWG